VIKRVLRDKFTAAMHNLALSDGVSPAAEIMTRGTGIELLQAFRDRVTGIYFRPPSQRRLLTGCAQPERKQRQGALFKMEIL
jgi:hypothetical protein